MLRCIALDSARVLEFALLAHNWLKLAMVDIRRPRRLVSFFILWYFF